MTQGVINTKVQYAPQTSAYATEGTSFTELARVQSCDLVSENVMIYDWGLGEGLNAANSYVAQFNCSGSVTFNPVDFAFLRHWIGNQTGAGTVGDPYILTEATSISAAAAAVGILQPFTIERLNDYEATDSAEYMSGCVGTTFNISGNIGQKVTVSANFVGRLTREDTAGETYTPVTDTAFIVIGGSWKWGATPSALSGVKSFRINYENRLASGDATRSLESRFQGIPVFVQRVYTFEVSIIMAQALAATIITDFYGQSPVSGPITSGSLTSSLEFKVELVNGSKNAHIQLDECTIQKLSRPTNLGDGLVILSFQGTARKATSNQMIKWWTV